MYQHDPDMAPDSDFLPGAPALLVVGNAGRMLDHRRTPIRVLSVQPQRGIFTVEVTGFEDKGAVWTTPLEMTTRFQINRDAPTASTEQVDAINDAVERFDRPMTIDVDPQMAQQTAARLSSAREEAADWLSNHSEFFADQEALDLDAWTGSPALQRDLAAYLGDRDLMDLEQPFATQFVSNPWPVGPVKGHRIVIAELGLCAFEGKVIRDPDLFAGRWSRERRAEHMIARMAFVQEVFRRAGHEQVTVFRGMGVRGPLLPATNRTFVSSTFKRELAEAFFASDSVDGVLFRARIPLDRLFMTYQETEAMNQRYKEAEALLLFRAGETIF